VLITHKTREITPRLSLNKNHFYSSSRKLIPAEPDAAQQTYS